MPCDLPCEPDIRRDDDYVDEHRPSWSGASGFLNQEHAQVWERTKDIPGWQDPFDSAKLYEMAYRSGAVMLEIGAYGGRSAVVQLRGALCGAGGNGKPQFYGFDLEAAAIQRTYQTLRQFDLLEHAVLFHGDLRSFCRHIPITPSMVFVDGSHEYPGVWSDLHALQRFLAAGTPILCHDYRQIEGVQRAVDEAVAAGWFEPMGRFGCSLLLKATPKCRGRVRGLERGTFENLRDGLMACYLSETATADQREQTERVWRLTRPARVELKPAQRQRGESGYAPWPYARVQTEPLPPTLPNGDPWPRISVVTPSYNQGRYIEETILSVANQDYANVEHIVIDGGSTDETREILERYHDQLAYVVSEPDDGQSDAINKGFAQATGQILTWLNSDDKYVPGALAAMALAFHTSGADVVAGICQIHREDKIVEQHLTCCDDGPIPLEDLLDLECCWLAGQFFYQPEVMFTREIWERAGARVDQSWTYSMDYELWLRFAEHDARLATIGRPIVLFRAHDEQKTSDPNAFRAELVKVRDAFLERTDRPAWSTPQRDPGRINMRITFFNDIGFRAGAGLAHGRLAQACAAAGHDVTAIAVTEKPTQSTVQPVTNQAIIAALETTNPDMVLLGNLHSAALTPHIITLIASRWPTVVVMHDQWTMTGRCAYTGDCDMYLKGCDHTCPTPDEYPQLEPERIHAAWETKRLIYSSDQRPVLLANSKWMGDFARSALAAYAELAPPDTQLAPIETIRLGFPLDIFRPRDRLVCRELLDLPRDRFIILTSASDVNDPRKGLKHLAEALDRLQLPDVLVVALGMGAEQASKHIPDLRGLGHIDSSHKLALAYAAADIVVGPSLEEALGQVFVEAAACGTPAIGYPVGGVPEAIADGITGRIAAAVNPEALADCIEELYNQPELRRQMGVWGRYYIENEWSLAAAYQRLFAALGRAGIRDRLGLRRKIRLRPNQPPPHVQYIAASARWEAVSGIGDWEGPYPEENLPRCRWTLGPVSRFEVRIDQAGPHEVFIECRNYWAGQRIRLVSGDRVLGEEDVPVDTTKSLHTLRFPVTLDSGAHMLEMHHSVWDASKPRRPAALLITNITAVPLEEA